MSAFQNQMLDALRKPEVLALLRKLVGAQSIEPLGLSINETAEATSESTWQVKQKLRAGVYRARKSGRRTIVDFQSVKAAWENLPVATFMPPRRRGAATESKIPKRVTA